MHECMNEWMNEWMNEHMIRNWNPDNFGHSFIQICIHSSIYLFSHWSCASWYREKHFKRLNQSANSLRYGSFEPSRCIKASFYIPENRLNFPTTRGFWMKISMKLVCQHMVIFFNFSLTSSHLLPLHVDNCDSNSRLIVDEMTMVNSGLKGLTNTFCKRWPLEISHKKLIMYSGVVNVQA